MMVLGTAGEVEGCKTVPYVTWGKEREKGEVLQCSGGGAVSLTTSMHDRSRCIKLLYKIGEAGWKGSVAGCLHPQCPSALADTAIVETE